MGANDKTNDLQEIDGGLVSPRFCGDCGLSLVKLDTWCTSRPCIKCGKEVFFVRPGIDGGVQIEAGDRFHIPQITLSLDPSVGGQFSRFGLEGFLKQLFSADMVGSKDELVESFKKLERKIDDELNGLDCISHCDLESDAGVKEAAEILDAQSLPEYKFKLIKSSLLRECYSSIQDGDAAEAAFAAHLAGVFSCYSLLEHHHLKEIIWLGYTCYVDLAKNGAMTEQSAKERRLIAGIVDKICTFDTAYLYALSKDCGDIESRLKVAGVSGATLKALVDHELDKRSKANAENLQLEEIRTKKTGNSVVLWGFFFTLVNGLIWAFYNWWLTH